MGSEHFGRARVDRALSSAERADARAALKLLLGSGISLEAAARRAIEGRAAVQRVSVDAAVDRFLRTKISKRPHTYDFYEGKLRALVDAFGAREMDGVSRADFRAWVDGLGCGANTRSGYVRAARALWLWAARQEPPLAGPSPTAGSVASVSSRGKTKGFLTVSEVADILGQAREWRPALALMLFAGVRVDEVAGKGKPPLTWREVDVVGKAIRIPGECAKITGQARLVQGLPEAVWAWLGAPGPDSQAICPGLGGSAVRWCKPRLKRRWPANALRHTFATYALAATGEPDRVSGWMGHENGPRLLNAHYAGLARRAEAEAFFALRPGVGP